MEKKMIVLLFLTFNILGCSKDVLEEKEFVVLDDLSTGINEVVEIDFLGVRTKVVNSDNHYVFQGDVFLDKEKYEVVDKNTAASRVSGTNVNGRNWRDNKVYYKISSGLPNPQRVISAILNIESNTNIEFIERMNESDYIEIIKSEDVFAYSTSIGRDGGNQKIGLRDDASSGNLIHEFCHALGMFHEHTRQDRDNYITVDFDHISEESNVIYQYEIYTNNGYSGYDHESFDFSSIMLYPSTYLNGGYSMVRSSNGLSFSAQRNGLSFGDANLLNQIYRRIESSSGSISIKTKFYFSDVNGDGKSDKIYWKYDKYGGDIRVFLATTNGEFSTSAVQVSGSSSTKTKFYFSDVNGDGKSDKIYWKYDKYGGEY